MNYSGCLLSPTDLRDYKLKDVSNVDLPEEYNAMPTHRVKSQGKINSCVAFAAVTIIERFEDNLKLSTNFIYGGRNVLYGSATEGMFIREAADILRRYGSPVYGKCPGNDEVPEVFEIAKKAFNDPEVLDDAYKHKIKSYVNLSGNKTKIKYAIKNFGPVIAALRWYDEYSYNKETGFVDFKKNLKFGHHAVVIYGWDKDGWLCQNSWGSKWGNNGLFKLRYEDGPIEAYTFVDDENLDSDSVIVRPTQNTRILDYILRFINFIIAKVFTRK